MNHELQWVFVFGLTLGESGFILLQAVMWWMLIYPDTNLFLDYLWGFQVWFHVKIK